MEKTLIIVPTYNEIEVISSLITTIFAHNVAVDVLVVDDNSPDGTATAVTEMMGEYSKRLFLEVRPEKMGLGIAYTFGFKWALKRQYQYIFEMDADLSHDPKEINSMNNLLASSCDVVVGSRYLNGVNVVNWPLGRILLSYFASMYVRLITGMPIKDATAGFVGYRRSVLEKIDLDAIRFVGYAFQIEMKYKAWLQKFTIQEHPIIFVNRELGKSKMDKKIIWEAMFGVLYLRIKNSLAWLQRKHS